MMFGPNEFQMMCMAVCLVGLALLVFCCLKCTRRRTHFTETTTTTNPYPATQSVLGNQRAHSAITTSRLTNSSHYQPGLSYSYPNSQSCSQQSLRNRSHFSSERLNRTHSFPSSPSLYPSLPYQSSTVSTLQNQSRVRSKPFQASPTSPNHAGGAPASVNSGKPSVKHVGQGTLWHTLGTKQVKPSTSFAGQTPRGFRNKELFDSDSEYRNEGDNDYWLQFLSKTHPLYYPIEKLFHSTWTSRSKCLSIIRIERVYNKDLFQEADEVDPDIGEQLDLFMYNDPLTKHLLRDFNEMYLLHGTSASESISQQGYRLDRSRGGRYGYGLYFTPFLSTVAHMFAASRARGSTYHVLLSRVLLGNYKLSTQTDHTLTSPPCLVCGNEGRHVKDCRLHERADSIVHIGDDHAFREFIVYDESQVFPEFRISYTCD